MQSGTIIVKIKYKNINIFGGMLKCLYSLAAPCKLFNFQFIYTLNWDKSE